jgi:hypothetical protein
VALEDFDILSPAPFGPTGTRLDPSLRTQPTPVPPPATALAAYTMKRQNDLEQIIEEDSIQPDASEIIDARSNDFHMQMSRCGSQTMPSFNVNIDENPEMILKAIGINQDDIRNSWQFTRSLCKTSESPVMKKLTSSSIESHEKRPKQVTEIEIENSKNIINEPAHHIHQSLVSGDISFVTNAHKSHLKLFEPSISSKSNDSQNKNLFNKARCVPEPPKLSKNFNSLFKKKKSPTFTTRLQIN